MNASPTQAFAEHGYLALRGFHSARAMAALRAKVAEAWQRIERHGAPSARRAREAMTPFQQIARLSTRVKVSGLHEAVVPGGLVDVIEGLAPEASLAPQPAQLLLSPPRQGAWTLQGLDWHVDVAASATQRIPGLQAFVLIDDVALRGGATLALAGSHRLAGTAAASSLREALRAGEDVERHLREAGVALLEMSGRAGDVYVMDMRTLHTPSINTTSKARMMATSRFLPRD